MTFCNAILISMEDGVAKHSFFGYADAMSILRHLAVCGQQGEILHTDDGLDAEQHFLASATLRQRVSQAKQKVELDTRIKSVLDGQGVPADPGLRAKFHAAFREMSCFSV